MNYPGNTTPQNTDDLELTAKKLLLGFNSGAFVGGGGGGGGGSVTQGTVPWVVSQSGTWTMQPGNTANTTPWLFTGGGTAGAAATGVLTVQGIASMTPLLVTSTLALPSATATGTTKVRNTTLNSAAAIVKVSAGNLFAWNLVNPNAGTIFVKFYDEAAGSVNPVVDVPAFTVQVPANSTYTLRGSDLPVSFATAISMRCVTGVADTDTTAPGTSPIIELEIK